MGFGQEACCSVSRTLLLECTLGLRCLGLSLLLNFFCRCNLFFPDRNLLGGPSHGFGSSFRCPFGPHQSPIRSDQLIGSLLCRFTRLFRLFLRRLHFLLDRRHGLLEFLLLRNSLLTNFLS